MGTDDEDEGTRDTMASHPGARLKAKRRRSGVLEIGDMLDGRYRILSELGRGEMGVVYKGLDPGLERRVAIKLVAPSHVSSKGIRERFQTEARAMARVSHPNVVAIHALGEHAGTPYFVMELVEGTDLETWLEESEALPLSIGQAVSILSDIGAGIEAIHAAGATHGDLKPSNVLVDPKGRVVVTDLGLARLLDTQVRKTLELAGTPAYMAPEVLAMEKVSPELSKRVDVYSLAVIAFELLTGQPPFDAENLVQLLNMHATLPPRPPSALRPEIGATGDEVLLAALAKDPRLRTGSARELITGLERMAEEAESGIGRLHVAIVDDDADFTAFARLALEGAFPSSKVDTYRDGASAIEGITRSPPAVALVDLQLPDINGLEVVATLRAECPRFPIAVVTGVGSAKDWSVLSSLGADVFLAKPLDREELVRAVRRLIGRSSLPPPPRA
ncbi:MAG: protein kinase [Sandaracinaceae bacterium]|nr:hypothetical protein [Myxococcales bacterium]